MVWKYLNFIFSSVKVFFIKYYSKHFQIYYNLLFPYVIVYNSSLRIWLVKIANSKLRVNNEVKVRAITLWPFKICHLSKIISDFIGIIHFVTTKSIVSYDPRVFVMLSFKCSFYLRGLTFIVKDLKLSKMVGISHIYLNL